MPELINKTPFSPMLFGALDEDGEEFQVVVLKGTFDLIPGRPLERAAKQDPVRAAPVPYEDEPPASLRFEDDLAPFKPRADVLVTGAAHAPGGIPARSFEASVRVGRVAKRLLITGPRVFLHVPILGWSLCEPEPTTRVRLSYTRAFGGGGDEAYSPNPIGRGFARRASLDKSAPLPAPSILAPGTRPPRLGKLAKVEGFSPQHRSWQARLGKAGTFDEAWIKRRHPRMPADFDAGFYNCAHPDLIYPGYLAGGEEVLLENLCEGHARVESRLPRHVIGVAITDDAGFRYGSAARLDTVHIDTDAMKLWLVWRAPLPLFSDGVSRVELVMTEPLGALRHG